VLRARFADAGFFFDRDRESTLESFRSALAKITFEEKVGSMLDRADRVERLANALGEQHLASADDREVLRRAAHLLHADLATSLVIELPALSGRVGRWYAQKDGEHAEVAQLVFEATLPRSADGELPTSKAAALLAVADRADVLVALFIAGSRPTGSADPQGLRRAATGLLQILLAHDLDLDLEVLFRDAAEPLEAPLRADTLDALMAFVSTRLEGRLADEGHSVEDVRALQRWHRQPVALAGRLAELEALRKGAEFEVVVAAYRRVLQLSKDAPTTEFDPTLSREPTEQALWAAFASVEPVLEAIPSLRRFVDVFGSLVDPIDAFFADVMIMAKDEAVRTNRLALLARIAASGAGQLRWDLLPSVR
jgi:glycyl-tRNA synthetase